MKILAIEFSSSQRSVAVVQSRPRISHAPACSGISNLNSPRSETSNLKSQIAGSPLAANESRSKGDPAVNAISENEAVATGPDTPGPLGLVDTALREAGLEREQIERIAIGLGPGSYTGIRCAIALAQGWELARGTPLLGISSAECLAARAHAEGMTGPVHVLIDAQRNEFYLATYLLDASGWSEVAPLALATSSDVTARLESGGVPVGPDVLKWFPRGRQMFPRAGTLGWLALQHNKFLPGNSLEPIYLRETTFVKAPPPRNIGKMEQTTEYRENRERGREP